MSHSSNCTLSDFDRSSIDGLVTIANGDAKFKPLMVGSQKPVQPPRRLKSGRLVIHTTHDPFPGVPDGIPVKVDVEVDTQAAIIVVDLTDNPDCQPCDLTLTESPPPALR